MRQLDKYELYRLEAKLARLQSGLVTHEDSVIDQTSLVDSTELEIAAVERCIEECKYSVANLG